MDVRYNKVRNKIPPAEIKEFVFHHPRDEIINKDSSVYTVIFGHHFNYHVNMIKSLSYIVICETITFFKNYIAKDYSSRYFANTYINMKLLGNLCNYKSL